MKVVILYIIVLMIVSCQEPFSPNIAASDIRLFVIDGSITDQPGPYTIYISQSAALNSENTFIPNLEVQIEEEDGAVEDLQEIGPGIYQTRSLQGVVGRRYRLEVFYRDQQIQSTWEMLNASPMIDSLYFKVEARETTTKDIIDGIQFYVDIRGETDESRNFRFEWLETWRTGVSWPISYDYLGNDLISNTSTNYNLICWKSDSTITVNLGSTKGQALNNLTDHKLGFTSGDNDRFTKRYSLLIKLYGLSEQEYLFWKKLKESNTNLGGLFDKQPDPVIGNLRNISSPSTPVLGYFSVSGLQVKRIFIDPIEIPNNLSDQIKCPLDTVLKITDRGSYSRTVFNKIIGGSLFYDLIYLQDGLAPSGALFSTLPCSDCVENGGNAKKPEFWDE